MKLISLVTGGDDAFGCDYVLVDLTPNLARLGCRRVAMLKEQRHMDASLVESYFWDADAEYFSRWLAEQEEADALAETLERLPAVAGDWMEAPKSFRFRIHSGCASSANRWSSAKPVSLFLPSRSIRAATYTQPKFRLPFSKRSPRRKELITSTSIRRQTRRPSSSNNTQEAAANSYL